MSFELPRRAPELRFGDSVRSVPAAAPPRPPPTLGRARPKAPPPAAIPRVPDSAPIEVAPPAPRKRDVYALEPEPTASFGPASVRTSGPVREVSMSDAETLMLDVDATALARAKAAAAAAAKKPLPVPHFRAANPVTVRPMVGPIVAEATRDPRLPMLVWVMTAIIAGVFSYRFAPSALEHVAAAVRLLSP
jgi:hypothetical protein